MFGWIAYDIMGSYWPTPVAMRSDPVVAEQMDKLLCNSCSFCRARQEGSCKTPNSWQVALQDASLVTGHALGINGGFEAK